MTPVRIVQVVGARPQFIKLAPVSRAFARLGGKAAQELIAHTGQHYDPQMSEVFFRELGIAAPHANLEVGSASHGRQTATMLERLEGLLLDERPHAVVVYGDTNSTLAGALCAAKLHIPVAHIEAGLRSYNRAMPEEINRVMTDHISDLLLAPTAVAAANLAREGLADRCRVVGDVMYDAVLENMQRAVRESTILQALELEAGRYAAVTVHRAESTVPRNLTKVLALLDRVAECGIRLVFPLHPRTREAIRVAQPTWRPPSNLTLADPLGSLDMLQLVKSAALVLTDSGGLQKEAFILGCPCITLRRETEWIETLEAGANVLVEYDAEAAFQSVGQALHQGAAARAALARKAEALYGQGKAAERSVSAILQLAGQNR